MKAFITGIDGFTGRHLARYLKTKKIKVSGIDRKKGSRYINCDLLDKKKLSQIIKRIKPDYIFHLASPLIRSEQLIDEALEKNLEVDLFGSVNLLTAAAQLKQKPKILITGTAAEYRETGSKPIKETAWLEASTSYGLSKLTQELVCRQLAKSYSLPLVCSRTFLLMGTGQKPGFVITDFARQVAKIEQGKQTAVLKAGNLSIKRDFTDVRDAVRAYWLLMKKGKADEAYNVCSGKSHSLKQVVDFFQKAAKKKFKVKEEKKRLRENDPVIVVGSNQKLKRTTGWEVKISFEQSLQEILDYWRTKAAKA